jgi:hypothetical protein
MSIFDNIILNGNFPIEMMHLLMNLYKPYDAIHKNGIIVRQD